MALQGTLDTFALADVLRLLATTAKTGRLRVEGDRGHGDVWLRDGTVMASSAERAIEGAPSEEIVFELLRFEVGSFDFELDEPSPNGEQPEDVEVLLRDANALLSEWKDLEKVVPSLEHQVTLVDTLPGDDVTIAAEHWPTVVAVGTGKSVGQLASALTLGELGVTRKVRDLVELGVVAARRACARGPPTRPRRRSAARPLDAHGGPEDRGAERPQRPAAHGRDPRAPTRPPAPTPPSGPARRSLRRPRLRRGPGHAQRRPRRHRRARAPGLAHRFRPPGRAPGERVQRLQRVRRPAPPAEGRPHAPLGRAGGAGQGVQAGQPGQQAGVEQRPVRVEAVRGPAERRLGPHRLRRPDAGHAPAAHHAPPGQGPLGLAAVEQPPADRPRRRAGPAAGSPFESTPTGGSPFQTGSTPAVRPFDTGGMSVPPLYESGSFGAVAAAGRHRPDPPCVAVGAPARPALGGRRRPQRPVRRPGRAGAAGACRPTPARWPPTWRP